MAQVSRFCLLLAQVVAVILYHVPSVSAGQRRKPESLENICGNSHSGIVKVNSTGPGSVIEVRTHNRGLPGSFHCVVKFTTTSNSSKLAYSIQVLDIPHACKSYLKLWGGDQTEDQVTKLCDEVDDPRGKTGRTFRGNVFYLKMVTHRDDWGFDRIGFVITVTALRISASKRCFRDEAACSGGDSCIYHKFYCDGINNCGDDSDEKCLSNVLTLVSIICGAVLITAIIAVFIYYIRRKRRLRPYDMSRATSTNSVQSDTSLFGTVRETYYRPLYPMGEGLKIRLTELPKDPDEPFLPPQYISNRRENIGARLGVPNREVTTGSSKSLEQLDDCTKKRRKRLAGTPLTSKTDKSWRMSFPPTRRPQKEVAIINEVDIQDLKNLSREGGEKKRIVLLPQ
ncbi:uncharacterized protein LOC100908532 [Galendromus occidentalis]|uniref:Uncharacterized protein LOC100908532 n=1 Tax=Galendromus occidentalis TaxID=34638 RepID=A0AAJ7SEK9_9ACAR|nr:uncharacterized protein LOC100908532 [Galendromus occidentalis]